MFIEFPQMSNTCVDSVGRVFYENQLLSDYLMSEYKHSELFNWALHAGLPVKKSWPKRHLVVYVVDSFYKYHNK